ncbi:aminoglycoside adenylyltransferase domain-containing protein [Paenibacillus sp.]|uniref:aminoglycoside adenylyltransferase domain-containing protein n=1 Tax=Paenibacillus sp. TaxID=58172 RepID=UPI002D47A28B|nr:aminoglycoside adenylyltransferase domain-containing protein [Paenibacillus sp.]HZG87592.1 aminoglycoside adenylyltransferase domain-containing protein [Paenibacillus sp.]
MSYGWANAPEPTKRQTEDFVRQLRETLGDNLIGVYLHGSLATDSFQPARSDVDVLAVCEEAVDDDAKTALANALLRRSSDPSPLEVHLCTRAQLHPWRHPSPFAFHWSEGWRGRFAAARDGADDGAGFAALPAFAGGVDADLAAHVRAARDRGVALYGAPAAEALPAVPDADVRAAILADVDVPFRDVSREPVYYVLNLLRAMRFDADGAMLSKEEAGVWGLAAMPLHIEVVADALKLYRRPEPRESLHFDVEPLQAFLGAARRRLRLQ